MMKFRIWLIGWLILVLLSLCVISNLVYKIDPFFHYHKPDTHSYFYTLDNQRSQNDGISKHFDYDALITGTSMTENFKTSEMDEIFGVTSVKVSYSGATYREINESIDRAINYNSNLKMIVRGLDVGKFFDASDIMRDDLGAFPTYLYDDNPFTDVKYLFNRDVVFDRVYQMIAARDDADFSPGITSFDDYSRWQQSYVFGINTVYPTGITLNTSDDAIHLSDEEKTGIKDNIEKNVTAIAAKHPDVSFYYFFTPYSIAWWKQIVDNGAIYKYIEAEKYIIELILEHENIYLYSFNNRTDITTNLNHYCDAFHYGEWINSMMLKWMHDKRNLLSKNNYEYYLEEELLFYTSFDYGSLAEQVDYENDFYAAAILNKELNGVEPINLLSSNNASVDYSNAILVKHQHEGNIGIKCQGALQRERESETNVYDYLINNEYNGVKISIHSVDKYNYLIFYGKKLTDNGQPTVCVYNEQFNPVAELTAEYLDIDDKWHQYTIDLTKIKGNVTIIFNGGYVDNTGSTNSTYVFSDIFLY